jgi:hypothetical protein
MFSFVVLKNILEWKNFSSESAVQEQFRLVKAINLAKDYSDGERELIFKTAIIFEQSKPAPSQSVSYKLRMDNGDWNTRGGNKETFSKNFMENKKDENSKPGKRT